MHRLFTALAAAALATSACSDGGSSPSTDPQLNFNLSTGSTPAGAAQTLGAPETFTDGTNTLVIDQVDVVLREVELKKSDASGDCDATMSHDSCEKLELGPILLTLPLGSDTALRAFSVAVSAGNYSEVEFEIHKPSPSDDAAFIQANPAFDGVSVHVSGTYNGAPFDFTSDLDAKQEIHFSTPLVVTDGASTELTLSVNLNNWFRDAGGAVIDPASAAKGQANENLVKDNIRSALNAFEDHDCDGADDHGEHQGGDANGDGQHGGADDGPNHT